MFNGAGPVFRNDFVQSFALKRGIMKLETYTLLVASDRRGTIRKVTVPFYALHVLGVLAIVGAITVAAAFGSYSRMLWKVGNYNALREKQATLQQQVQQLQKAAKDSDQRLSSLQSLATDVAVTYGFVRLPNSPFEGAPSTAPEESFEHSVAEFNFLQRNVSAAASNENHIQLVSAPGLGELAFTPTLWPVVGGITSRFGERLDPFSGEGAVHTGVDISAPYGDAIRATADGEVREAAEHMGYGRLVIIDHGFGVTTYYGHLSSFTVPPGIRVKRGDIIGYIGVSGRTTGPHVHYEVRINNAPVNPMRYLRYTTAASASAD
jgi:murein DD-endopeptidase MepM/ murein hydrolase activator NlpD